MVWLVGDIGDFLALLYQYLVPSGLHIKVLPLDDTQALVHKGIVRILFTISFPPLQQQRDQTSDHDLIPREEVLNFMQRHVIRVRRRSESLTDKVVGRIEASLLNQGREVLRIQAEVLHKLDRTLDVLQAHEDVYELLLLLRVA